MTIRAWRLTFAMQGLVLWLLVGATVLLTVGSALVAWQMNETRAAFVACLAQMAPGSNACQSISAPLNDLSMWGNDAKLVAQFMPVILGLFLGVPVVAREIEGRTAPIAWALDPGRGRWLLQRALPVLALALVAGGLIGIGGELLTQAPPFQEHPLGAGFSDYGSRLGQVPVRAIVVLMLGIAVGTLVPRYLPALLLTLAASLVFFIVLTLGIGAWMQAEAERIPIDRGYEAGARLYDQAFQDNATGALISTSAFDQQQEGLANPASAPPGMTRVWLGVPGEKYGLWVARESAVVLGMAALLAATSVGLVRRKRPD